ncbi:predicted protein [Nematostella vectensis]|uniref:Endonuclease/exonuclease/phosphatase domain-containing protein n=1 Tax=Nematostella vectensis TaxID=45351 RepID=A7SVI4_NEMVE|nr:predicted protein [Nematostella vectensis]|eukprot:XP_001624385.1 predicted protein [Nematostella vectensis]
MAATRVCVGLSACARLSLRSSRGRATRLALDSIRLARPCTVTGLKHESYYYKPSTLTLPRKAMEEKISKIYKVKERGIEIVSLFRLQKILTAAQQVPEVACQSFYERNGRRYELVAGGLLQFMGEDPENFNGKDIQRAIEYLMPTALYAKDARPLLLHPNKLFTKRRGRVSYYNCSTSPSFNLCELRITRSDDVESNPGFPGHSLSVFYQNTRSLKAITWDTEDPFMKEMVRRYELCRRWLASIMGEDPENFNEKDIQRAIEYLMPTALYAKDARPLLLHPNKLFTKRRGRVSYYNCSTSPSFNLCELRITRSDDVESNPGFPGHSLSVFYQNTRSLKAITWDTEAVNPLSLSGAVTAVEVKLSSNKLLLVAVCYRAPDDNEFLVPFRSLTGLTGSRKYAEVLIVGDFNFPKIQWVEGSGFVNSDVGIECEFANILSDMHFSTS